MINIKDFILKIKFLMIAIPITFFIKFLIRFFLLNSVIHRVKKISALFLSRNNPIEPIHRINFWYNRLNRFLKIKSCFTNSLIKKIIFSSFGHNVEVVCGIRLDSKSNIDGHAWLCYKENIVFEDKKCLMRYTESFRI